MDKVKALAVINRLSLLENIFKGYMISLKQADLYESEVALKENSKVYKKYGVDYEKELSLIEKASKKLEDDSKLVGISKITRSDLLSLKSISSNIGLVCAFLECNRKDNEYLIDKICKIDELIFLRVIYNLVEAWQPYYIAELEDISLDYRESIISVDLLCTTLYQFKEIIGRNNKDTLSNINRLRDNLDASLNEMDEAEKIGEESQDEIDFFDRCLRPRRDFNNKSVVYYDDEDIYRETIRFRSYLLEIDKEDRTTLLELVTEKLLYAYFSARKKVNGNNPKDGNRRLMTMYDMIITSIVTNICWNLKIKYSDDFKKEWENKVDKGIVAIKLLNQEKPHSSTNKKQTIPKELDTKEAKDLFEKTAKFGYCTKDGSLYRWIGTLALLGYFVDKTSKYLKIRSSNNRIPWKIFKEAFQCEETDIATAKSAVNDYKNKTFNYPIGYDDIEKICKK